jgi:hypothetical protein
MTSLLRYFRLSSRSIRAYRVFLENPGPNYSTGEIDTGSLWIDGSPIFRKVIDIGALPDSSSKLVNHGLTAPFTIIHYYGFATDGAGSIALPTGAPNPISITSDATQINVTTTTDLSSLTSCFLTIEYIKA